MPRRSLTLLAATGLVVLSACGVSGGDDTADGGSGTTVGTTAPPVTIDPDADPDQILIDSVDATLDVGSFTVDSDAELTIATQELYLGAEGSLDYDDLVADASLTIDQDGETSAVELLADGTTLWVRTEGDAADLDLPDGIEWVEGEASRLGDSGSFASADLIGVIIALRGAQDTEVGDTEELDGIETTRYTTTMGYSEAVDAAGDLAEQFQSSLSLTADEDPTLVIDAWVGTDGLIRKFELDVQAADDAPLDGTYSVVLTDVGAAIDPPEAPDPDATLTGPDADELLDRLFTD